MKISVISLSWKKWKKTLSKLKRWKEFKTKKKLESANDKLSTEDQYYEEYFIPSEEKYITFVPFFSHIYMNFSFFSLISISSTDIHFLIFS